MQNRSANIGVFRRVNSSSEVYYYITRVDSFDPTVEFFQLLQIRWKVKYIYQEEFFGEGQCTIKIYHSKAHPSSQATILSNPRLNLKVKSLKPKAKEIFSPRVVKIVSLYLFICLVYFSLYLYPYLSKIVGLRIAL